MLTLRKHGRAAGYFSPERFAACDGTDTRDEIAMNITVFRRQTPEEIASTLTHGMVHQWQQHFGKPPRRAYHNKEWANQMEMIGLMPSSKISKSGSVRSKNGVGSLSACVRSWR